jgi:hypothetical protein
MKIPKYFQDKLAFDKLFGDKALGEPTKENAMKWAKRVYCELSPENLTCDGELSRAQVNARYRALMDAIKYLNKVAGTEISEEEAFRS